MIKALTRLFYTHLEEIDELCDKFFLQGDGYSAEELKEMGDASMMRPYYLYYDKGKLSGFFVLTSYTDYPEGILIALEQKVEIINAIKKELKVDTVRLIQIMSCASQNNQGVVYEYSEYMMKRFAGTETDCIERVNVFPGNKPEEQNFYKQNLLTCFNMSEEDTVERMEQVFSEENFQAFFLKLPSDEIIGCFGCYFGKKMISLFDITIAENYRNQGYAKRMLSTFLEKNKEYVLQVSSKNKPAVALYQSLGFQIVQQQDYYLA